MTNKCAVCEKLIDPSSSNKRFCSRSCFLAFPALIEEERFWIKVAKGAECWTWTAKGNPEGYGVFWSSAQRQELAHRAAWRFVKGPIPSGMLVLHECDNPACVRPDHLFLGTNLDNYHDCERKGRLTVVSGARHPNTKLTTAQILQLQSCYVRGVTSVASLARQFGVSKTRVSQILQGDRAAQPSAYPPSLGILSFGS